VSKLHYTVAVEVLQQTPPSTGQICPLSGWRSKLLKSYVHWRLWRDGEGLERARGVTPSLAASLLISSLFAGA